jgi:hypothetical protein
LDKRRKYVHLCLILVIINSFTLADSMGNMTAISFPEKLFDKFRKFGLEFLGAYHWAHDHGIVIGFAGDV